ncbi:DNA repair protein RecO [Acidaminobacter sp. JC074]|uniref:DNA repair protein RecO n=1 Tax=Acidaminobacter sp. JC074 TaxID=2530199 RepID=UPI001F0DEB4E|nr:DNA repair protein RecO [Acidaminobacter sp. JC074]MCH4887710.1 DNA repair protein RecO [Acidaminobacter sp. JC074]
MYIVTDGIVLKRVKVSDYDKILTIFTRKAGKVSAAVKGSQNPKSKLASGAHPFVYGEFSISKSGRLSSVTSIDVKNAFYHLREDLDKLTIASYFLELAHIVTVENIINNSLFDLLLVFLQVLEGSNDLKVQHLIKIAFELKLLDVIGLRPELNSCVNCGKETDDPKFTVEEGGVICKECYHLYPDNYRIGHVIPKLMKFILASDLERILETDIDPVLVKKIDFILNEFLLYHLERKGFRTLKHFNEITSHS